MQCSQYFRAVTIKTGSLVSKLEQECIVYIFVDVVCRYLVVIVVYSWIIMFFSPPIPPLTHHFPLAVRGGEGGEFPRIFFTVSAAGKGRRPQI